MSDDDIKRIRKVDKDTVRDGQSKLLVLLVDG